MAATVVDSAITGNLYSTAPMRAVWSDARRLAHFLAFERALAQAQGALGVIPADAATAIAAQCMPDRLDLEALRAATEAAGSPVIGLVAQLTAGCAGEHGQYVHWGATTQDVTDTALVLQVREALDLVETELDTLAHALAALARAHRDTPMAGRTFLQHAVPITFGYKLATTLAALDRHRERLAQLRPRLLVGQLGGACGTLASLGSRGLEVRAALLHALGLGEPSITWHAQRDTIVELGHWLVLVGGTLGKLATDVKLLMQTEVAEVAEPAAPGRGASSTMPQKRNPVASVHVLAIVTVLRQHAAALAEAQLSDHERASGAWQVEAIVLPEMFCLLSGALAHAVALLAGLQVDAARMRANLALTQGLVAAEAVMMRLAPALGRARAHHLVGELARRAQREGRALAEVLAAHPDVAAHATTAQLAAWCDPANYLGQAGEMVDRVLAGRAG